MSFHNKEIDTKLPEKYLGKEDGLIRGTIIRITFRSVETGWTVAKAEVETSEEEKILIIRLEKTLVALGGARPKVSEDEIQKMLNDKKS